MSTHFDYASLAQFLSHKNLPSSKSTQKEVSSHLEQCSQCWEIWNRVRWDFALPSRGMQELKEYLMENKQDFKEYYDSSWALAYEWNKKSPSTSIEVTEFYKHTTIYLYNLVIWYESNDREDFKPELDSFIEKYKIKSFIDYGCGVGNDGLYLLEKGMKVYFVDLDCPSVNFLKWRIKKRGLEAEILDVEKINKLPDADMLYAIDVLEHMPNPLRVLDMMSSSTRLFSHRSQFNNRHGGRHPFHFNFDEDRLNDVLASKGFSKINSHYLLSWYKC